MITLSLLGVTVVGLAIIVPIAIDLMLAVAIIKALGWLLFSPKTKKAKKRKEEKRLKKQKDENELALELFDLK